MMALIGFIFVSVFALYCLILGLVTLYCMMGFGSYEGWWLPVLYEFVACAAFYVAYQYAPFKIIWS